MLIPFLDTYVTVKVKVKVTVALCPSSLQDFPGMFLLRPEFICFRGQDTDNIRLTLAAAGITGAISDLLDSLLRDLFSPVCTHGLEIQATSFEFTVHLMSISLLPCVKTPITV